jgi:thiol-disulfide isomerase/thioredoxin
MSRNLRMGLLLACGILLMAGSTYMVWRGGSTARSTQAAPAPMVLRFASNPEPAPSVKIQDLSGKTTTMDQLKGKVVLVNFWATWCPPCRGEIPELIKLQAENRDRLEIIGVSEDDEADTVQEFVKKNGINYPVVMATPQMVSAYGGVTALPTTFVVDPQGRVVQRHLGALDANTTEQEVRYLSGLPVPGRVEHFEDTGQIFSKNLDKATELPGVDLSGLTPQQKKVALRRMNQETCTCGCKQTVAECVLDDPTCAFSRAQATKIVQEVKSGVNSSTPSAQTTPANRS